MANVKVGNFVRQADLTPIATIIQIAPIYVTFTVPQRTCRTSAQAMADETATVQAIMPGDDEAGRRPGDDDREHGRAATGMVTVRATMPNTDEAALAGHAGDSRR